MSLEQKLSDLHEGEQEELQGKMRKLKDKYAVLPETISRTAELTGIPAEKLVSICVEAAFHYRDLNWDDVLDVVRSFYLAKKRREEEGK